MRLDAKYGPWCDSPATWNLFQKGHPEGLTFPDGVPFFCPYMSACDEHKDAVHNYYDVDEPVAIEPKLINADVQCCFSENKHGRGLKEGREKESNETG